MNYLFAEIDSYLGGGVRTTKCDRCGLLCKLADKANADARILKASTTHGGFCATCAASEVLHFEGFFGELIREDPKKLQSLLDPVMQEGFGRLLLAGNSDANLSEINWQELVANWDLPFPNRQKKRRGKGK